MTSRGPTEAAARSGRRPGNPDTKELILTAARNQFADSGFERTSVRSIAAEAGVDSALVHHYFGTKRALFLAAVDMPVDPQVILSAVLDAPIEEIGELLLRGVLGVWESPQGTAVLAAFRAAISGESTGLVSNFLTEVILRELVERVDEPPGSGQLRATLVASQLSGLLITRYLLRLEPIASLSVDEVVVLIGPTVQRYLTGAVG
ncbi:TetR family transcriptional regulator [Rhodococcus sp. OK611]|jgi:AcrR family transcriptional regulator|uniref:TetR/AcrR family transcriptional regulator n=1 Tax=unclassified Rhodococcus (in: high G+C Gram-positive bacteria) TaxID=192944 RepID=UPI000BDD9683|nr:MULTISPECIES: TetR family transcriptional regulator [unclassified Rhodococcus (in: high G+C Gram-positive bacteria)]PTR39096.1 TetR family transcriptional regulator [Rhodococcus sp. OK611]SNX92882.1 transcriptional regulator, TetR family [Rhodococcus sp. OK270]